MLFQKDVNNHTIRLNIKKSFKMIFFSFMNEYPKNEELHQSEKSLYFTKFKLQYLLIGKR